MHICWYISSVGVRLFIINVYAYIYICIYTSYIILPNLACNKWIQIKVGAARQIDFWLLSKLKGMWSWSDCFPFDYEPNAETNTVHYSLHHWGAPGTPPISQYYGFESFKEEGCPSDCFHFDYEPSAETYTVHFQKGKLSLCLQIYFQICYLKYSFGCEGNQKSEIQKSLNQKSFSLKKWRHKAGLGKLASPVWESGVSRHNEGTIEGPP